MLEKKIEHKKPSTVYLKNYQAPNYFIDDIHLNVELNSEFTLVQSTLRIRHNRHSTNPSRELRLNGEQLVLQAIELDGKPLSQSDYTLTDEFLILPEVPENFTLKTTVTIYPHKNTALSGLYRSRQTYCTQCEAEGFRRITYFIDQPDILTRFTTTLSADKAQCPYLLSNGNLIQTGDLEKGRHFAKWEDPFKKSSYLFALVAGDFDLVEDFFITMSQRKILLNVYVEKGSGDQAFHALYSLKEALRWDEQTYGREYDLDVYMIVAINDFNMGAMENKGLNIFNTKYVLAKPATATDDDYIHILSVVGHEYFHNWSGNRVTCRDWFQLSLKEGLTIFRDQTFSEDLLSKAVMRIRDVNELREIQFPEDAGPLAHNVRPESYIEINNFYTATVYNKGAEIVRMLFTIFGPSLFRKGMDLYFARYDGQAVTIEDYIRSMEDVSGVDLSQFRLWYSQAGTPHVAVEAEYDAKQKIYRLTMHQTCPPTPEQEEKQAFYIPIRMGLLDSNGQPIELEINDEPLETEKILHLKNKSQSFEFKNIQSPPIPSLLRHFSAPIKLNFPYKDQELLFLFRHDQDAFMRWEASQHYMLKALLRAVESYQAQQAFEVPQELINAFRTILQDRDDDSFLLAEMLQLPSERYIAEEMDIVDVDAIHAAHQFFREHIANALHPLFFDIYHECLVGTDQGEFVVESIGKRQLKNRCLSYLMLLPQYRNLGEKQFYDSLMINMTDTQAALTALVDIDFPERKQVLEKFYEAWQQEALVVDKWFAIQAVSDLPDTFQQIKMLTTHKAFDLKNPNKVYALIGSFAYRNLVCFHHKNGEGYSFLGEIVQQLDVLNPQIAAKMVKPLTRWQRYDKDRQKLMKFQLEKILKKEKISPDLYEIVSKSLNPI